MYYRIEVNRNNIGTFLETPFSLNPRRVRIAYNPVEWQLLSALVDISLSNNLALFNVCSAAVSQNPDIGLFLHGIWEVLFERARPAEIPLRRTECTFFFTKETDALSFKSSYPGMVGGVLCEVEILNEAFSMKADMNWVESINENTVTAKEAIDTFRHYWAGEMTSTPIEEVLFVGKYKLNPVE